MELLEHAELHLGEIRPIKEKFSTSFESDVEKKSLPYIFRNIPKSSLRIIMDDQYMIDRCIEIWENIKKKRRKRFVDLVNYHIDCYVSMVDYKKLSIYQECGDGTRGQGYGYIFDSIYKKLKKYKDDGGSKGPLRRSINKSLKKIYKITGVAINTKSPFLRDACQNNKDFDKRLNFIVKGL